MWTKAKMKMMCGRKGPMRGEFPLHLNVSLYKVARTQPWDLCWMHSFKSYVKFFALFDVFFYYMSKYPFNKSYKWFKQCDYILIKIGIVSITLLNSTGLVIITFYVTPRRSQISQHYFGWVRVTLYRKTLPTPYTIILTFN